MTRYQKLAAEIAGFIRSGAMKPGDRLPSVRQASASRAVSATTVLKAYHLLEAQGLIRAHAGSGYYVTAGLRLLAAEPRIAVTPIDDAALHDPGALAFQLLEAASLQDLVPFGSSFPSAQLFPLPRLARAMTGGLQRGFPRKQIDPLQGNAELRRQIALRYLADGIALHPEEIVVTSGSRDALNLSLQAVAGPGDYLAVPAPGCEGALEAIKRLGMRAIEIPAHPRDGMDLGVLARVLKTHRLAACLSTVNFQNPLGSLMPEPQTKALVELLAEHGVPLIEDDVYGELYFGRQRPAPAKAFDRQGLVLHCSSFSKCLAPGHRVGWVVPGRSLKKLIRLQAGTTGGASAPAQAALAGYLGSGGFDKHLRRLRQTLRDNRDEMMQAIARYLPPGTVVMRPEGGYFLWVQLPGRLDAMDLHRRALAAGVSLAPGPMFSVHHAFRDCIRLNYGHPWDARAESAMALLGQLISLVGRNDMEAAAA